MVCICVYLSFISFLAIIIVHPYNGRNKLPVVCSRLCNHGFSGKPFLKSDGIIYLLQHPPVLLQQTSA